MRYLAVLVISLVVTMLISCARHYDNNCNKKDKSLYELGLKSADCRGTLVYDFKQKIATKEIAISLLKEFYSEKRGFKKFDSTMITGPLHEDPSVINGTYQYYGRYGFTKELIEGKEVSIGGLLCPNGKLVRRGYCK